MPGDTLEGVFGCGGAPPFHRSPPRRREHDLSLPRVRHLAQDRVQELRALQGPRSRGPFGPVTPPVRYANQLPGQLEAAIFQAKRDKPHWGARKIRELLPMP